MNEQFVMNELRIFHKDIQEVEQLPLHERKSNRDRFKETLEQNVELFIERVEWLLNGSYGQGSYLAFERLTKRMNRRAWLFVTTACLEWHVPNQYARDVWNKLDTDLQAAINRMLDEAIEHHETQE
jgi:hypothetical protein